jgi:hypothetical protein
MRGRCGALDVAGTRAGRDADGAWLAGGMHAWRAGGMRWMRQGCGRAGLDVAGALDAAGTRPVERAPAGCVDAYVRKTSILKLVSDP